MLSSSSYVLDLQSILDLKRVLGFFFLLLTIIKYCLCTSEWKPFQMILSFDYQSLPAGHFGHFTLFFSSFFFHDSVLSLCMSGHSFLTWMTCLPFTPTIFGTSPLEPDFFSLCLCLLLGQWNQFCHPIDTTHKHLWLSLCSRQIKFCFLFHLVPDSLLRHC